MEHVRHRTVIIATLAFLAFLGLSYVYVFDPFIPEVRYLPGGVSDFRDGDFYQMDSQTILASLDGGETNVFTPVAANSQAPIFEEPISWQQSDFLKVARGLNQFIWKEPLSGWKLYSMNFSAACQDDPIGFSEGDFYYFKTVFRDNGKIRYSTQDYSISPQTGAVSWAGGANFPHPPLGWASIRLSQIKVTAEDALRIAEENGGRETRLLAQNKCRMHMGLLSGDAVWQVFIYQDDTGSTLFRMKIDTRTGRIE